MHLTLFGDTNELGLPGGWTKETIVVGAGDVTLDLSRRPPGPNAVLTVFRLVGDVKITAPPNTVVQVGGVTLFGDRKVSTEASDGPVLRLNISGVAGDVVVEESPARA